jgi:hypothetical protein
MEQCTFECLARLIVTAQCAQTAALQYQCVNVLRMAFKPDQYGSQSIRMLCQRALRLGQVEPGVPMVGHLLAGALQKWQRLGVFTTLAQKRTQQLLGIWMFGLVLQQFLIQRLRLIQLTGPVQGQGLFKRTWYGHCGAGQACRIHGVN